MSYVYMNDVYVPVEGDCCFWVVVLKSYDWPPSSRVVVFSIWDYLSIDIGSWIPLRGFANTHDANEFIHMYKCF